MSDAIDLQKVIADRLFMTRDEAAQYALDRISQKEFEEGGVLYSTPQGLFSYSDPQGQRNSAGFRAEVRIPKKAKFVGIYHSHPQGLDGTANEFFSADDVATADAMRVASYIRAMESGNILKYEPGKTKVEKRRVSGNFGHERISKGDLLRQETIAKLLNK